MARDEVRGQEHADRRRKAITYVLDLFAAGYPRAFPASNAVKILEFWALGLRRVETDSLVPAAKSFLGVRSSRYAPEPPEFREYALEWERRKRGEENPDSSYDKRRRAWAWAGPDGRMEYVELRDSGWVYNSGTHAEPFSKLAEHDRASWCDEMQRAYGVRA